MSDDLKARLLAPHLPEGTVDVPGVGTIHVRGLSRAEVLAFDNSVDAAGREQKLVALAMTSPRMTEEEVATWQTTSGMGEIESVADKIMRISGLKKDAAKEVYREFEADPAAEFPVLPGREAGDDGGPAPSGDE